MCKVEDYFRVVNPDRCEGRGGSGVTGSLAAVANAVADALARAGATAVLDMPLTAEAVWRACSAASPGSATFAAARAMRHSPPPRGPRVDRPVSAPHPGTGGPA